MENTVNKFWPGKTFFLGKFFWQKFWQNFGKFFSGIFFSGIFFGQFFQEFFFENFFWQFFLADFQRCASNLPCRRVTTHTNALNQARREAPPTLEHSPTGHGRWYFTFVGRIHHRVQLLFGPIPLREIGSPSNIIAIPTVPCTALSLFQRLELELVSLTTSRLTALL